VLSEGATVAKLVIRIAEKLVANQAQSVLLYKSIFTKGALGAHCFKGSVFNFNVFRELELILFRI